jgi:hypothetical protein
LKAFLSHSSHDKAFVRQVYNALGASQAHLDAATFEKARLNIEAIHSALRDSDVFVLFLSENSLDSDFVHHESLLAMERLAGGTLQRIMLICIDTISLERVDPRLRNLNIVTHAGSIGGCTRRIQSCLVELSIASSATQEVFVGRESEIRNLKSAITKPSSDSPSVIAISGIDGVGRRTLIKKIIFEVLPSFAQFASIHIERNQGLDDLFRSLIRLRGRTTLKLATQELIAFCETDDEGKLRAVHQEISDLLEENETLMVIDSGGLLDDEGDYHTYIKQAFAPFDHYPRPAAIFIQRRMPPFSKRKELTGYHFERVSPLGQEETRNLIGAKLKAAKIDFTSDHVRKGSSTFQVDWKRSPRGAAMR